MYFASNIKKWCEVLPFSKSCNTLSPTNQDNIDIIETLMISKQSGFYELYLLYNCGVWQQRERGTIYVGEDTHCAILTVDIKKLKIKKTNWCNISYTEFGKLGWDSISARDNIKIFFANDKKCNVWFYDNNPVFSNSNS